MKAAIIGMGSIGKRHYKNLKSMGIEVKGYDLGDAPSFNCDFVLICTHEHFGLIHECVSRNVPFFVEKPVVSKLDELEDLEALDISAPNMVACNLRFTSALDFAKGLANKGSILNIHARVCDSNPSREKYGDIVLQDIHEFDYLYWLFGPIKRIDVNKFYDGKSYEASILFKSGRMASVHGDMLSETYFRRMTIQTKKYTFDAELDIDNRMYEREMEYFAECVWMDFMPMNNLKESLHLTRRLLEALNWRNSTSASDVLSFTGENPTGTSWTLSSGSCN